MMYLESVRVYNNDLVAIDAVTGWSSVVWTERYQDFGEFEIRIPDARADIQSYKDRFFDNLLQIPYSNESMIVEEITYEGGRTTPAVYLRGRDAKSLLQRRVLAATQVIPMGPSTREIVLQAFNDEVANPSEKGREMKYLALDDPSSWSVHHLDYDPDGKSLWDLFLYCAQTYYCGLRSYMQGRKIRYQWWKPRDRTGANQTYPVLFSEDLGSLSNIVYRRQSRTYRTSAYVHIQVGENQSSLSRYATDVSNRFGQGMNRREMWVSPGWNYTPKNANGLAGVLAPYGRTALHQHSLADEISGEVLRHDMYEYGFDKDFFLGDLVAVEVAGKRSRARVKEYTHSWTIDQGYRAYPILDASPIMENYF
jgi:hypothetical protein|nr:MAG TPA: hypothetical protein [Caudoviricetes sp.]